MNIADKESRQVLGPAGNKARPTETRKPVSKPVQETEKKKALANSPPPTILRRYSQQQEHHYRHNSLLNSSMSASFSSEASSSDSSSHSGRVVRRKQSGMKVEKAPISKTVGGKVDSDDCLDCKKRCAWITPNTGKSLCFLIILSGIICVMFVYVYFKCVWLTRN